MKINNSISKIYKNMSNFGKILIFVALFLILIVLFKSVNTTNKEGYEQNDSFLFKQDSEIYDDFYVNIYDHLVFNNLKDDYEIGAITNKTLANSKSVILDIGSGTGHHVDKLAQNNLNVTGIDNSASMVAKSKINYPNRKFINGDALDISNFYNNQFTHILCLNFTIYHFEDKMKFFYNCMEWLMPGGTLIVHLVNREKIVTILSPETPLYVVSPQKDSKERITKSKITFNEFVYSSNLELEPEKDIATFHEKFKFNDGKTRKQEHKLYMNSEDDIINMAQETGFLIQGKIDLVECAYEYQYLYILVKPQ
jgi:2-polyprenyl-3-methyl-5-hydroxy-6-metoxy-1,4-benzoquinol methylase